MIIATFLIAVAGGAGKTVGIAGFEKIQALKRILPSSAATPCNEASPSDVLPTRIS